MKHMLRGLRPTDYSCAKLYDRDQVKRVSVNYDYEIAVSNSEDLSEFLQKELPRLETGLLWATADHLGMWPCADEPVVDPIGASAIVGVSSLQEDLPDVTLPDVECQYLPLQMLQDAYCVPMKGHMEAEFLEKDSVDPENIRSILLDAIAEQMKIQRGLPLSAVEILFIGNREEYANARPVSVTGDDPEDEDPSSSTRSIGTVSSVVTLSSIVVIFLAYLLVQRRRRPKGEESNSFDHPAVIAAAAKGRSRIEDEFDPDDDGSDCGTEAAVIKDDVEQPQISPANSEDLYDETNQTNVTKSSSLPPLPPTRSSSPTFPRPEAQRGRPKRRKKKKKAPRPVLRRVNSRESIKEMEVIPEAQEYDDNDDESEYTWTDDEGSTARDPSPSPSLTSSISGTFEDGNKIHITNGTLPSDAEWFPIGTFDTVSHSKSDYSSSEGDENV